MRNLLRGLLLSLSLSLGLGLAGFLPFAQAADPAVPAASAKAVQQIVRAQLDAFQSDDAKRAWSYATAGIQQMFGTPDQFMDMVRSSYPAVYRPASIAFLTPKPRGPLVVQPVHLTDQQGSSWIALYSLERQKDKSWRIAGCVLVPEGGQSI